MLSASDSSVRHASAAAVILQHAIFADDLESSIFYGFSSFSSSFSVERETETETETSGTQKETDLFSCENENTVSAALVMAQNRLRGDIMNSDIINRHYKTGFL